MSLTRRRSGLKKTNPYVESETPESSALGPAMTVGNLAMKGAQIHDTTMKTKVTESNILNKKVTSPSSTDVRYDVFEHTPTSKGELGWGRSAAERTQLNPEVVDQLKSWEEINMIDDPSGSGKILKPDAQAMEETMNPSNWERYSEAEVAKEFGYDSADAFTNAKTTGNVEMKLSDGSTYKFQGDYYEVDPAITEQAGQVQQDAMGQFKEFIYGPSGMEGYVPPGTEATISKVGETALTGTGELAKTTVSGTQLVPGSKVMTLANGNTVPLAGKALAVEKATLTAVKGGADAASASVSASTAKASVGAKIFGDVAAAHASATAAGATAAEVAAAGAAAITPVGWTLIAIAIVAVIAGADERQKKKKKKKRQRANR